MDFIEALPRVNGKTVILTVVDCFSKFAHFIPLSHPYTTASVAQVFFQEIVRLHGLPSSIMSDRDPVFTSAFWKSYSAYSVSNCSLHQHSTPKRMDNQRPLIKSLLCIFVASLVVILGILL